MRGATESLFKRLLSPQKQVTPCLHASAKNHRLANFPEKRSEFSPIRTKTTRSSLTMHNKLPFLAIDFVLFNLCDIMRDIIHKMHLQLLSRFFENLRKTLPNPMQNHLPI